MVLTGSSGVGGRMHWRVLRVMSSSKLSAHLLIMEIWSRTLNYNCSATLRDSVSGKTTWHHHAERVRLQQRWLKNRNMATSWEEKWKQTQVRWLMGIHLISWSMWDSKQAGPVGSGLVWEPVCWPHSSFNLSWRDEWGSSSSIDSWE